MSDQTITVPAILDYEDFRLYLRDYHQWMKSKHPAWNFRRWAQQLQLKSPSTLVMIIKGQRTPRKNLIETLASFFQFAEPERQHFVTLVELARSHNNPVLHELLKKALHQSRDLEKQRG